MGGSGDSPVSVGDPPTATGEVIDTKPASGLATDALAIPSGGSPDGTGGSPVLPAGDFSDRLCEWLSRSSQLRLDGGGVESFQEDHLVSGFVSSDEMDEATRAIQSFTEKP